VNRGKTLFVDTLHVSDPEAAVAALSDVDLLVLSGWLGRHYDENAPSGTVLGLCLVEGFKRWKARAEKKQRRKAKKIL
jgi:hypothetical protein